MNASFLESTQPERMRIGDCVVDVASREVQAPRAARPRRLTPKAMAVLRVLAARPGQVVSRDDLLAEVWPDTLPTNDVVTQAVTQLRKAFAAGGDSADYIETIAKTGYRLLAPVAWEAAPAAPAAASDPGPAATTPQDPPPAGAPVAPAPRRRRAPLGWAAAAICAGVVAVALAGLLVLGPPAPGAAEASADRVTGSPRLPYRLITSGGGFDLTPTLSPDASMVAYTSMTPDRPGTAILVKTTNNASPRVLSKPAPGQSDRLPAWSPDGRDIAFARQGADGRCQVMVTAANGGDDEREVARCDDSEMLSFSWSPDGTSLLFGSMTGRNASAGLRLLDLRTGQWRALAYPSDRTGFDYAPRYSPDGRWIAFVRNPQMGDLWLLPAQGGTPRPLTRENAEIRGWDWLPDSRGVVFGRRVDSQSRLYRLDLDSHRVRDLGISDAQTPALSDGKLAFVQRKPQFGIYRIQRDATDGSLRRQRLFASTGRDSQSIVSPSGRQLVFTSDRSGEYALWWASLADPQSLRPIEGLIPEARQAPDWSPDSLSLLVVARDGDGEPLLHEVLPALNRSVVLPVQEPRPLQAVYLSDPQRILVLGAEGDGNATLALYDRSVTPWRRLRTLADVSQVRFDREHGRVLFTRFSGDGLWRVDEALDPASVQALDTGNPSRWQYRSWALGPQGRVHYLFSSDRCPTYEGVIGPGAGDGHCLDGENFSALNGFSVDRADGTLYVPLAIEDGSGIGFMTLPKEPSSLVGVVSKWLSPLGK